MRTPPPSLLSSNASEEGGGGALGDLEFSGEGEELSFVVDCDCVRSNMTWRIGGSFVGRIDLRSQQGGAASS